MTPIILTLLSKTIAVSAIVLLLMLVRHVWFWAQTHDELGKRAKHIFIAELIATLSILSFNGAIFFVSPAEWVESDAMRIVSKVFQLGSILLTIWVSYRFGAYYRKIK